MSYNIPGKINLGLWTVRAEIVISHDIPLSTDTLNVQPSRFTLASQGEYFVPPIQQIGSMVKSLCNYSFDLEKWQFILTTGMVT